MFTCKIDDTPDGAIFNSLQEIANFLGVTKQYVTNCKKFNSDKDNHFLCRGYPITILSRLSTKPEAIRHRKYYKPKGKPMTSKLKCPFCGEELEKEKNDNYTASPRIWQALIQAKQDLEIATKAVEKARINLAAIEPYLGDEYILDCKTDGLKEIDEALEQIEHKE